MTLLKTKEIKTWSLDDKKKRLKDLRNDLLRERGQAAMGGAPISPGKIRAIRTNIARILTIENQMKKEEEKKLARAKKTNVSKQNEGERKK